MQGAQRWEERDGPEENLLVSGPEVELGETERLADTETVQEGDRFLHVNVYILHTVDGDILFPKTFLWDTLEINKQ